MAYTKTAGPSEHPSRTIVKTMQAGIDSNVFPKVVLLCGKEDFLVSWALGYIKSIILNPGTEVLDYNEFSEDDIDPSDIIAAAYSPALMSKRKLVAVRDTDIFTQQPKDLDSASIEQLTEFIPKCPEETMLVFTCNKPNKTKAIYKAIAKCGIVYDFTPLDDATLGGWMAKRFQAAGKNALRADMINFARLCGYGDDEREYTLYNLENDLKVIFALYDKTDLCLDDMLRAVRGQAEVNSFKLLDSAFSGKKGEALEILHSSIDIQIPSKEMGVVLSFLGLLISQLEIMLEGKERLADGLSSYEAIADMKVNEYRFKKAMEACNGKSVESLRKALASALQIEKDMKSGNIDGRLALELFIAKI